MAEPLLTRRFMFATSANMIFFIAITSFFALPVHLEALGENRAEIGRIMGTFGIASLVWIPLTGALADRFGRRRFMMLGALLWAVVALGFVFVKQSGPVLYLLRFGQGMAFSLAFVATNAVVVDLAPEGALGRAIALFGSTTLIAHAFGPSAGEWVAQRFGFERMFELSALVSLAACGAFALIPDVVRSDRSATKRISMFDLALRPGARGALVSALGTAVAFGAAITFMPVFVRSRGLPSHAPFFVCYVLAAIAVRLLGNSLGDRVGHRPVAALASLGFAASAAGFAALSQAWHLWALALVFGVAHGLSYPSMNALFVENVEPGARGRAMALFNLAFNVGFTLSAFLAGEIAEAFDYGAMWLVAGATAAAGTAALVLDGRRRVSV